MEFPIGLYRSWIGPALLVATTAIAVALVKLAPRVQRAFFRGIDQLETYLKSRQKPTFNARLIVNCQEAGCSFQALRLNRRDDGSIQIEALGSEGFHLIHSSCTAQLGLSNELLAKVNGAIKQNIPREQHTFSAPVYGVSLESVNKTGVFDRFLRSEEGSFENTLEIEGTNFSLKYRREDKLFEVKSYKALMPFPTAVDPELVPVLACFSPNRRKA